MLGRQRASLVPDQLTAQKSFVDDAVQRLARIRCHAMAVLNHLGRDRERLAITKDHQVRIGTDGNYAFSLVRPALPEPLTASAQCGGETKSRAGALRSTAPATPAVETCHAAPRRHEIPRIQRL